MRFRNVVRRAAVVVAAGAVALPLSTGPASAARLAVEDGRGDMWKIEEGSTEPTPAPAATQGDVLRTTFRHADRRVHVRVRFADLAPTGKRFRLWVDMRDERGRVRILGVDAPRSDRDGRPILMTGRGRDIDCDVHHRIRYQKNLVTASVPRSCLGRPRSVQFRVLSEQVRRSWRYAWLDNGLAESMDDRGWTARVRRG